MQIVKKQITCSSEREVAKKEIELINTKAQKYQPFLEQLKAYLESRGVVRELKIGASL